MLDDRIDLVLDLGQLFARDRAAVGNIKADTLTIHHLALLRDMIAQHAAQSFMHNMGRGVIMFGAFAISRVHAQLNRLG